MTNRTIKVLGWGDKSKSPANITVTLDGEQVFSGLVNLEEFSPDSNFAPVLFTVEVPVEFEGTKALKITVADAAVRFGQIIANYSEIDTGSVIYATGEDDYVDLAQEADSDGVKDPRTNVKINGFAQTADRVKYPSQGTWHWTVNPGSTLEHDLIIKAGILE